jgi:ABC-type uncharacterized transport system auxiliary subunit
MSVRTATIRSVVFLLGMLCLATPGCVRGTRPASDLTHLDIDPGAAPAASASPQGVLLLRRFDVESPFDDRRFHYKIGAGTYRSDYYVRFVASPADLLTDRLETWLQESGLFRAVVEPGSSVEYDYILEGEIVALHGDYSRPKAAHAVIKAEFVLVDDREGAGEIVFEEQYEHAEPLTSSEAHALAVAWGTALRKVFLELTRDLQRPLASIAE